MLAGTCWELPGLSDIQPGSRQHQGKDWASHAQSWDVPREQIPGLYWKRLLTHLQQLGVINPCP